MATRIEHHVPHHFDSAEQAFDTSKLGMWAFLVTEVLMFSGLFLGYSIFRYLYPEMYFDAHKLLNRPMGAINTVVLILSSLTMALAVRAAQTDNQKALVRNLFFTFCFAGMFMVIKYFEYSHKFHVGQLPGAFYHYQPLTDPALANMPELAQRLAAHYNLHLFFSFYFMMTGLHGVHVLAGMVLIGWLIYRARRGEFYPGYYTPVEMIGLFWHIVDLIWIYLFPLYYLIG